MSDLKQIVAELEGLGIALGLLELILQAGETEPPKPSESDNSDERL
jgi:hypothetical protein